MKFTKIVRVQVRVIAEGKNKKKKYRMIRNMARESRFLRNDSIRNLITYHQMKHNGEFTEEISNRKYLIRHRRKLEYLSGTMANQIEHTVIKKFRTEYMEYIRGQRSYPMFRDDSIFILGAGMKPDGKLWGSRLVIEDGQYILYPAGGLTGNLKFELISLERDKSARTIIDRIIDGDYKLGSSQIRIKGTKLFLHASYTFEREAEYDLDPNLVCGVDVGFVVPVYVALSEGYRRDWFGDKNQIMRFRTQIQTRRRNLQSHRNDMKGSHGRARAMSALDMFSDKEGAFVKSQNRNISKKVIDFCLKYGAGTIHMEKLDKSVKGNSYLGRNWTYYDLQTMIEYKAKEQGILVEYMEPAYTSQMCSNCGYIHKKNRDSRTFKCRNCGYGTEFNVHADYNAAVNIARSSRPVSRRQIDAEKKVYFVYGGYAASIPSAGLRDKPDKVAFTFLNGGTRKKATLKINWDSEKPCEDAFVAYVNRKFGVMNEEIDDFKILTRII